MTIKEFIHEMEYATCDITDCSEFIRFCGRLDVPRASDGENHNFFPQESPLLPSLYGKILPIARKNFVDKREAGE